MYPWIKLAVRMLNAIFMGTLLIAVIVGIERGEWSVLFVFLAGINAIILVLVWELIRIARLVLNSAGQIHPEMEGTVARLREWIREVRS